MISIFGNEPLIAPSAASSATQLAASTQHPAVSKKTVPLAAPSPWRGWKWFSIGRSKKRLQMLESVSLGEKRFVALVQVDGRQFLIGGAPSNVGMLAELAPEESFHQVLKEATQGLDIPIAASVAVAETSQKAVPVVAKAEVATSPSTPPEASSTANALLTPAVAKSAVITHSDAVAGAHGKQASVPVPQPVGPIDPVDPVDSAFDAPVSLSPSLLAAMQAKAQTEQTQIPAPQTREEAVSPVSPVLTATQPALAEAEVVELQLNEAKAVEAPKAEPPQRTAFVSAPRFTFQVSQIFGLGTKTSSEPFIHKSDPEHARRIAAAWNLQGATS